MAVYHGDGSPNNFMVRAKKAIVKTISKSENPRPSAVDGLFYVSFYTFIGD